MESVMEDFIATISAFLSGVILATIVVSGAYEPTSHQKQAKKECQKAGYHGGDFTPREGYICFNYVSERLVK